MPKLNELIINGRSTSDLPFFCAVEENSAPTRASKKNKYHDLDMVNGAVVQTINAWSPIPKTFQFYLKEVTKSDVRKLKEFIGFSGWLTSADDPDIRHVFIDASFDSEPLDEFNGYTVTVTFTCEPFEYEPESETTLGSSVVNHTNAPMYPKVTITAATTSSTYLEIGSERMTFPNGFNGTITIECKHGIQDVKNSLGASINNQVRGPFFEILPGTHTVTKGTGITTVKILNRWGWL